MNRVISPHFHLLPLILSKAAAGAGPKPHDIRQQAGQGAPQGHHTVKAYINTYTAAPGETHLDTGRTSKWSVMSPSIQSWVYSLIRESRASHRAVWKKLDFQPERDSNHDALVTNHAHASIEGRGCFKQVIQSKFCFIITLHITNTVAPQKSIVKRFSWKTCCDLYLLIPIREKKKKKDISRLKRKTKKNKGTWTDYDIVSMPRCSQRVHCFCHKCNFSTHLWLWLWPLWKKMSIFLVQVDLFFKKKNSPRMHRSTDSCKSSVPVWQSATHLFVSI